MGRQKSQTGSQGKKMEEEMMGPHDMLLKEHKTTQMVLDVMDKVGKMLQQGDRVPKEHLRQMAEFLKGSGEQDHFIKEEDYLFPLMRRVAKDTQEQIGHYLEEHNEARKGVKDMMAALEGYRSGQTPNIATKFAELGASAVQLLRDHTEEEEKDLYPLIDRQLSQQQRQELKQNFEHVDKDLVGEEKHKALEELAKDLAKTYLK